MSTVHRGALPSARLRCARPGASKPLIVARAAQPDAPAPPRDDVNSSLERSLNSAHSIDVVPAEADGPVSLERTADAPAASTSAGDAGGALSLEGSLKGMVLLNLGAMLFGSNQVVIKTTEELLSPVALDALRFGAAALCFAPLLPRALKQPQLIRPALELGAWLTAGYTAQAFGLSMTSASHGAFTGTFTVLAVPLLVGLSGRRIAGKTWVAGAAALLGVSLLTTSGGDPNWGDAICVLSALLFGVHKWRSESITAAVDDTTALVALQLAVLAGTSLALAAPEAAAAYGAAGGTPAAAAAAAAGLPWLDILFMGVGTTALTLWIEMDALKEVSAPLAALIYSAEPLWGAAFAWVLLEERWGAQGWVGAALIVAASLASQLGGDPAEKAATHKLE